jgi:SAM-dependent methyltransferase
MGQDDLAPYFSGEKLYGDSFTPAQISEWFADEAEGYADLRVRGDQSYEYRFHELNRSHAFRFLDGRDFGEALGIGSAFGEEFRPIADRISRITILDPSDAFANVTEILDTPCEYRKPATSGDLEFDENRFGLITSLGVLHHIPNVSHVLAECYRCMRPGGVFLLREPIVSMGDWRKPRAGLTKRERGIPLGILDRTLADIGYKVVRRSYCMFSPIQKMANVLRITAFNNSLVTSADSLFSRAMAWNYVYHRTRALEKLGPASIYYVLEK